ncbi:MAG TPA: hypothetical protein VG603_00390 [Chitinophagales bacterium]|nr:hypothetical protein [Chitinophagales bacterium]
MLNKKIAFALMVVLGLVAACKKSTTFDGAKIEVETNFRLGRVSTYTYNSDGTLNTISDNIGNRTLVDYSTGTALLTNYSSTGAVVSAISYQLNSANYADTAQGQYQLQNYRYTYTYDGNGQLTQQNTYTGGALSSVATYSISNKNVTQLNTSNAAGTSHSYDYYAYDASNTNSTGLQNHGYYFLGASSANVVLADVKINSNGDTTDIIKYKYHYDGSSRIDTMASYNRNGQLVDSMAYTYF